jgi:uncharacterized surface protein with fasciclin (FAS1) repeats
LFIFHSTRQAFGTPGGLNVQSYQGKGEWKRGDKNRNFSKQTISLTICSNLCALCQLPHSFHSPNRNLIMKKVLMTVTLAVAFVISQNIFAQTKDVVDVAMDSKDHTTLVAAVKAAGLVETLKGAGPFTVFAPTNAAFNKLPAGTVDNLLKPENKEALAKILTYHVVAGNLNAVAVIKAIKDGKGKAELTTVQGGKLTASLDKGKVMLTDEAGHMVHVTATDLKGSNGVIHVIDGVVMPK